jgi:hypothetical protein
VKPSSVSNSTQIRFGRSPMRMVRMRVMFDMDASRWAMVRGLVPGGKARQKLACRAWPNVGFSGR